MPREITTDELPEKPIRAPIRRSKKRPTVGPTGAPESASENTVYWLHELLNFEQHRKCHPNYFGEYLGEFLTPLYAKRWLKDHNRYGAFAIVERTNGKIGKSWPYEIDPPDDDAGVDYSNGDLRVENAVLKARLDATRNGHGSISERLLEQVIAERLKPVDPLQSAVAAIEAVDKIKASAAPRISNPAPANDSSPARDKILNSIIENTEGAAKEKAIEMAFDLLSGEKGKKDIAMEILHSPQLMPAIQALGNIALGLFDRAVGAFGANAPAPEQPPQATQMPQAHAQQQQQAPAPQQPMQAMPETAPQQPQTQTAPEIASVDPYTAMLSDVITTLMKNGPVDGAIKRVEGFLLLAPQYEEVINNQFSQPAEMLLGAISGIPGCETVATLNHARQWIEQFQAKFFDEGGEFDSVTELNQAAPMP